MRTLKYVDKALKSCVHISSDKVAVFSDLHLGTGTYDDEAMKNNVYLFQAFKHCYDNGYTVVLLGDTFELARNRSIEDIKACHDDLMWVMKLLFDKGRLYIVRGNHDQYMKPKDLATRFDTYTKQNIDFLKDIRLYDSAEIGKQYLLMHGHQYHWMFQGWCNRFVNFICRHDIFHTEKWLVDDPTKASLGYEAAGECDEFFKKLSERLGSTIICGHTHSVKMNDTYYNTGAGILNRCVSFIEIVNGSLACYKWSTAVDDDGTCRVVKTKLGD